MNSQSSIKNCPFCKNQIPANAEKCPICKMTLIERVVRIKIVEPRKIDSQSKVEDNSQHTSNKNFQLKILLKDYLIKTFNFLKRKKAVIVGVSVIILFFYFISINNSKPPEKTLYNYELSDKSNHNKKNTFKSNNNNETHKESNTISVNKENSLLKPFDPSAEYQQTEDFDNIPEKYISNGKIFFKNKRYFTGLGKLIIKNGTNNDAVVKLVPTTINKSAMTFYVRRNSNFTIKKIIDGNYKLYFVVGRHYDEDSLIFLQDCSFAVFEEGFPFKTDKYQSVGFEITLHPVVGGKARTDKIRKNEFLDL